MDRMLRGNALAKIDAKAGGTIEEKIQKIIGK